MRIYELITENKIDLKDKLKELKTQLKKKYDIKSLFLFVSPLGDINLSSIIVDKQQQNSGMGSAIMQEIINFADNNQVRVVLTPGLQDKHHGTTSRNRLIKFYKKFGFVLNKGRNKDFRTSELMYREPKL